VLDSSICVTIINQDSIFLNRVDFRSEDQANLEEFKKCISIKDYCSIEQSSIRSQRIFDLLFKPFEALLNENIIIVPHGPLNSIPFEALFDADAYLVERKNISYAYSINLHNSTYKGKRYFNEFLAIAPSYKSNIPDYKFDRLTKNSEEVESVGQNFYFKTVLKGDAATKANFISNLKGPNIVHIAGHADIDPEDSDYSFIAFNDESGEIDSSLLFLSELYADDLNIDMLVLSACNTGIGKYKSGEGILSLTRGFLYAGVKSVISSLWQMEENKSAQLLDYFYHHLSKGKSKNGALTLAKRDYLDKQSGDFLHPFYWSGFVVIGDKSPIFVNPLIKYIIGIIFLLLILFLVKRCLKHRNNFVSDIT
jgi:CHAT domain-containing protein